MDDSLGTQTKDAYIAAVDSAPHLGDLAVVQMDQVPHFQRSKLGLSGSYVSINPRPEFYLEGIRSGKVAQRLGEFSLLYRSKGIAPGLNELVVAILLHEIGHADDFAQYIRKCSGDTVAAFDLAINVRDSELATLPLKEASATAEKAWNENTGGYRDSLKAQGITDEQWLNMVEQNTREYGKLPCERVADAFALGVLATVNA